MLAETPPTVISTTGTVHMTFVVEGSLYTVCTAYLVGTRWTQWSHSAQGSLCKRCFGQS